MDITHDHGSGGSLCIRQIALGDRGKENVQSLVHGMGCNQDLRQIDLLVGVIITDHTHPHDESLVDGLHGIDSGIQRLTGNACCIIRSASRDNLGKLS